MYILKATYSFYYLLAGTFFIKICKNFTKNPSDVKLFRLAEFLTELAEFLEIIDRGTLKNFGNSGLYTIMFVCLCSCSRSTLRAGVEVDTRTVAASTILNINDVTEVD